MSELSIKRKTSATFGHICRLKIFRGRNLLKHRKVKAEQEQNKKLQNQIREMEKKIQDLGEEHKKEISKIKKVCSLGDSNLGAFAQMCILGTLVRNIKIKFGMGNKDEITGR